MTFQKGNMHQIETKEGSFGLHAAIGYDSFSELYPPEGTRPWRFIGNRRYSQFTYPDGQYDPEDFYGNSDLSDWLRGNHDADLMAVIRYESHGPYGRFLIEEEVGFNDIVTKGVCCELIAAVNLSELKGHGHNTPEARFKALRDGLEQYSEWRNGSVYRYVITDHRSQVVDTKGQLYDFPSACSKMERALANAEQAAETERRVSDEWAARDVITIDAVPGAIGAVT